MQTDFLILGADGMQGSTISRFLCKRGYRVSCADLVDTRLATLDFKYVFHKLDVADPAALAQRIRFDNPRIVINCVEGDLNLDVYRVCLRERVNVIDLGSSILLTKKQLALNRQFKESAIIGITGCGSTPGINNVMFRHALEDFDEITDLDLGFAWDSNLKEFVAPFSMGSVLYELSEPAHFIEGKELKKTSPLKSGRSRWIDPIGKQELFLVHHPEIYSFNRFCKKKGKQPQNVYFYAGFPEHSLATLKSLVQLGFSHSEKPVTLDEVAIYPTDFLTMMLKNIDLPDSYVETEVLWVSIKGLRAGKPKVVKMVCIVDSLPDWRMAGCNIDTAFPAALIAEMIYRGEISSKGSFSPEEVVPEQRFFNEIAKFGMRIYKNGELINGLDLVVRNAAVRSG